MCQTFESACDGSQRRKESPRREGCAEGVDGAESVEEEDHCRDGTIGTSAREKMRLSCRFHWNRRDGSEQ